MALQWLPRLRLASPTTAMTTDPHGLLCSHAQDVETVWEAKPDRTPKPQADGISEASGHPRPAIAETGAGRTEHAETTGWLVSGSKTIGPVLPSHCLSSGRSMRGYKDLIHDITVPRLGKLPRHARCRPAGTSTACIWLPWSNLKTESGVLRMVGGIEVLMLAIGDLVTASSTVTVSSKL